MVKSIVSFIFLTLFAVANFQGECMQCHREKGVSLRKVYMNALLVYGGEKNFKTGLFYYCKNPTVSASVMDEEFLEKFLPLKPVVIDDVKLKKLLKIYWEHYKVKGKLK